MAHFAQLDNNNFVINVIRVADEILVDENGKEVEQKGIDFCKQLFGYETNWAQTSYNASFRKNYAGIGYFYDKSRDMFVKHDWIWDEEHGDYVPADPHDKESWLSRLKDGTSVMNPESSPC